MGATLVPGGATFRAWAPGALAVHVLGDFNTFAIDDASLLTRNAAGVWEGFIPGAVEWQRYIFHVAGTGGAGRKRDPYARELTNDWPNPDCILREPGFPWSPTDFTPPPFHRFVIYQLHAGTFFAPRWTVQPSPSRQAGTFLDIASKIEHLAELGVNCIQLLPIVEFRTQFSMGYNGVDYFSPEMDFAVPEAALAPYRAEVDRLLTARGQPPSAPEALRGSVNQLKMLVNLCHLYDIAVIFDVVYNHAGGDFGDQSMYFFDREAPGNPVDNNRSLYFLDRGHAGGLVFAMWRNEVRQFLIDNALFFLREYRVDGFRYDQVSVIVEENANHGWRFCQNLTSTCRFVRPSAIHHAEYWPVNPFVPRSEAEGGAGFDCQLHDGLRDSIRRAIAQASIPGQGPIAMSDIAANLRAPGFTDAWRAVQGPENHDVVYRERAPRVPALADGSNSSSWFARSRSRVALGITLAAPGIPMLFMGQEFLDANLWADDIENHPEKRPDWISFAAEKSKRDFFAFARDLIALRLELPGLTGEGFRVVHVHDGDRVLAFHRWVPGIGADVLIVASLRDTTFFGYEIGFPGGGFWREAFNSDVYENLPNPSPFGNGGGLNADGPGMHGFEQSAPLIIPANSIVIFSRA